MERRLFELQAVAWLGLATLLLAACGSDDSNDDNATDQTTVSTDAEDTSTTEAPEAADPGPTTNPDKPTVDIPEEIPTELREADSKLMIVTDNRRVVRQLRVTGALDSMGEDNIYLSSSFLGQTVRRAHDDALVWIRAREREQVDDVSAGSADEAGDPSQPTSEESEEP